VTKRGRFHPTVQRLARSLARAGYLVAVPDPPGLKEGVLSERTLHGAEDAVRALLARPQTRGGRVSLYGVSVGGSLALLIAEDPEFSQRIRMVGGLAPYANLADVVRLATTNTYMEAGRIHRYRTRPFAKVVASRSLAAALPAGRGRPAAARSLARLLTNRDPARFDSLYAALPRSMRSRISALSPISGAKRLRVPVLIASAPHDKYFPPAETRALARMSSHVSLTITPALQHAIPHFSLHDLAGIVDFDFFVVRVLRAAR
jgi:dienelactone hydrolase